MMIPILSRSIYNNQQQPNDLILQPKEIFVFSKDGDEDYDNLDIYLLDQKHRETAK